MFKDKIDVTDVLDFFLMSNALSAQANFESIEDAITAIRNIIYEGSNKKAFAYVYECNGEDDDTYKKVTLNPANKNDWNKFLDESYDFALIADAKYGDDIICAEYFSGISSNCIEKDGVTVFIRFSNPKNTMSNDGKEIYTLDIPESVCNIVTRCNGTFVTETRGKTVKVEGLCDAEDSSAMSCSERHNEIKNLLSTFAKKSKSFDEYIAYLKKNKIGYEDYHLANGRQVCTYTGSSGYEIVGVCAKWERGHIILEDIFNG